MIVDAEGRIVISSDYSYTEDFTVKALWTAVYTIKLDNQNALVKGSTQYYQKYGEGIFNEIQCFNEMNKIVVPERIGYTFGGYFEAVNNNATISANGVNQRIKSDGTIIASATQYTQSTTLYALWIPNTYNVTYNLFIQDNEPNLINAICENNSSNENQIVYGEGFLLNNPTRSEHDRFVGWYADALFTTPINDDWWNNWYSNPKDITLYAKWDLVIYYNSLESTPKISAIGDRTRVVVDWSGYSAGTYDYCVAIDPDDDGFNSEGGNTNIDINNNITEIYFIGNSQATFTGVSLVPCFFSDGQNLNLKFKDFKLNGPSNKSSDTIWGYECGNFNLNMEFSGENVISSSIGCAITKLANLNITGSGNLTVSGANGTNGGEYATGGSGQVAISVDYLTINTSGTMNINGGNGGNGGNTSSKTSRANSLRTAGSGGNGADAISCVSCTINGNVTIKAGNGGNGGYGYKTKNNAGIGGDGGNGGHGIRYSETYSVSENVTSSGGSAGSGGGAQKWNAWGGDQQPGDAGSSGSSYYKP